MAALTLDSGCGCIELRTSSFIIAYIDLVLHIILSTVTLIGILVGATGAVEGSTEEDKRMAAAVLVISAITQVYLLLMLAFNVTLLVGLHKTKRILVKVYLMAAATFFLLDFVVFFVGFVHAYSTVTVVTRTIALILEAYSFLVIRSYYYQMDPRKGVTTA